VGLRLIIATNGSFLTSFAANIAVMKTKTSSKTRSGTATRPATARPAPTGSTGLVLLVVRLSRMAGHRMALALALAAMEMRTHEFAVLNHLSQAGPLSQQELGQALRINPSNLVGLLDLLEADGLLVRVRDPHDRRRHLVELTAAGRHRLLRACEAAEEAEDDLCSPLSKGEREQLRAMLERLVGHACGPGSRC
jgi:DNA-binding MarR family transcriptional regulator